MKGVWKNSEFGPKKKKSLKYYKQNLIGHSDWSLEDMNAKRNVNYGCPAREASEGSKDSYQEWRWDMPTVSGTIHCARMLDCLQRRK